MLELLNKQMKNIWKLKMSCPFSRMFGQKKKDNIVRKRLSLVLASNKKGISSWNDNRSHYRQKCEKECFFAFAFVFVQFKNVFEKMVSSVYFELIELHLALFSTLLKS